MAKTLYPDAARLRQLFTYNPKTGELRWRRRPPEDFVSIAACNRWNGARVGKLAGNPITRHVKLKNRNLSRGTIAWIMMTGHEPACVVDHINGNCWDNRWRNLREATHSQNTCNRTCKNGGLPKGVRRNGPGFSASITVNHVGHYLGQFTTPEEAHHAYCEAGRRLHGKFFEHRNKR